MLCRAIGSDEKRIRKKLTKHAELWDKIQIIPSDAASFEIEWSFPVAFLSGSYDHFVSDEERKASLMNISQHLLLGGILVFEVFLGLMGDRSFINPLRKEIRS